MKHRAFGRRVLPWILHAVILLLLVAWVGTYLHWRKKFSVQSKMGRWGTLRLIVPPHETSDWLVKVVDPLTTVDGWLTGESVGVGKMVVSMPGSLELPNVESVPSFDESFDEIGAN